MHDARKKKTTKAAVADKECEQSTTALAQHPLQDPEMEQKLTQNALPASQRILSIDFMMFWYLLKKICFLTFLRLWLRPPGHLPPWLRQNAFQGQVTEKMPKASTLLVQKNTQNTLPTSQGMLSIDFIMF